MSHNAVTQNESEDMAPQRYLTERSNGVWYFKRRYPKDIIDAGLVKTAVAEWSLGTKNRDEAEKQLAIKLLNYKAIVDEARGRLGQSGQGLHGVQTIGKPSLRPVSSLTKNQQLDLVIEWFVEAERIAENHRNALLNPSDEVVWDGEGEWDETTPRSSEELWLRVRDTTREDFAVSEGPETNWENILRKFLKKKGLSFKRKQDGDDLLRLIKRANRENFWRTLAFIENKGSHNEKDVIFRGIGAHTEPQVEEVWAKERTIADLCDEYLEAKRSAGRAESTLKAYQSRFTALKDCFGPDAPLSSLFDESGFGGYEAGKKLFTFLSEKPLNSGGQKKNGGGGSVISPKTLNDYFIDIKAMFAFAMKRHWISMNPLDGFEDSLPEIIQRPKVPLTGEELTRLLSSDRFLRERGRIKNGRLAEGRFWCVLLCLFHGMRSNEAASLLVTDVKEEEGIWYLHFTEFDDDGNIVKRLKNKASRRRVPIHREVLRIGFLDFFCHRRDEGNGDFLFDELKANSMGNRGDAVGKWFGRMRNLEIGEQEHSGDKSLHAFRHAMADGIRAVTESDEILYAIGGWSSNQRVNSSRQYGKGHLPSLKKVIDQVSFEGFDPSFLYPDGREEEDVQ